MRKKAELAERKLALARREIAWLRKILQQNQYTNGLSLRMTSMTESSRFKMDIFAIADLLNYFHGNGDSFEGWEKQVRLLKTTYELDEKEVKILMCTRLKEKASEWSHSEPEFHQMNFEDLLIK